MSALNFEKFMMNQITTFTKKLSFHFRKKGILSLVYVTLRTVYERAYPPRPECYPNCLEFIKNKIGLEIGGPSFTFSKFGLIPVYGCALRIDNCNFSNHTIWEGEIVDSIFRYRKIELGNQFISEASNLIEVDRETYDFIISSQMLQHSANPLRALSEWHRVLRQGGTLILTIPHMKMTFDHRRPHTTFEHLLDDFDRGAEEDDLTHLEEVIKFHDLERDLEAGTFQEFKSRSEQNPINRGMHQHVYDEKLAIKCLNYAGFQVLFVELIMPFHILLVAQKVSQSEIDNSKFLSENFKCSFIAPNIFWGKFNKYN